MKRIFRFLTAVLLGTAFLTGCNQLKVEQTKAEKVPVMFGITTQAARTALPDVDWTSDYTYTVSVIENCDSSTTSKTLLSKVTYASLTTAQEVSPVKSKFTLDAYSGSDKVFSGTTTVDLTTGAQSVTFRMYPVTGVTGAAEITVSIASDADAVKTIKAGYSTNPLADYASTSKQSELVITDSTASYELTDLPSATTQFAILYLYDDNGGLIGTIPESLVIVGGKTSSSTITIDASRLHCFAAAINLKKDGVAWTDSGKLYGLKNSTLSYAFKESSGVFAGSVAEGTYTVCEVTTTTDSDTGVTTTTYTPVTKYNGSTYAEVTYSGTTDSSIDLSYFTVTLNAKSGTTLAFTSTVKTLEDGSYIALNGETVSVSSAIKSGYNASNFTVKADSTTIGTVASGTGTATTADTSTISGSAVVSGTTEIVSSGTSPISYSITYNIGSASWETGYTAPSTYTVESNVNLPTLTDILLTGKLLDGWSQSSDGSNAFGYIKQDTLHQNLSLYPKWKDSASVDTSTQTIYANGISLIIMASGSSTVVYTDLNANGTVDGNDTQLKAQNGTTDFTGYDLYASASDGTIPASNFTFTVLGGTIGSLVGLGSEQSNISTVNISGTAVIGSVTSTTTTNSDGTTTRTITEVHGIDLASLTGKSVNIVGQMSGSYSINLVADTRYVKGKVTKIATITNKTYAQLGKFTCVYQDPDTSVWEEEEISINTEDSSSYIYLKNTNTITLPDSDASEDEGGIIWIDVGTDESHTSGQFTLGDAANISIGCSVFSLFVENGTFVPYGLMQDADGNNLDTENLGTTASGAYYDESSTTTFASAVASNKTMNDAGTADTGSNYTEFVYMHMFSTDNSITAEIATNYLKTVKFKKDSTGSDIKLTVKLETVPYSEIEDWAEGNVSITNSGSSLGGQDSTDTVTKFSYYNGSFYAGVSTSVTSIRWSDAYNGAKQLTFNGLSGYLINITSDIENNYIYQRMGLGRAWTGGARFDHDGSGGHGPSSWDADQWEDMSSYSSLKTTSAEYMWQSGPEAGQAFTTITWSRTSSKGTTYTDGANCTGRNCISTRTNSMYANWDSGEPNDAYSTTSGSTTTYISEQCVHFLTSGKWNDYNWDRSGGSDNVTGYIVEFTPYNTTYGKQVATNASVSVEANY